MPMHVVKDGDTIESVAKSFNVSPLDLMVENRMTNQNHIYPGRTLQIPGLKTPKPEVQEDDGEGFRRASVLPLGRDKEGLRLAVPGIIYDAVMGFQKVVTGEIPTHIQDPETGEAILNPEVLDIGMKSAALALTGGLAGGAGRSTLGSGPIIKFPKIKKKPRPSETQDLAQTPLEKLKFHQRIGEGEAVLWKELSDADKAFYAKVLQDAGHPEFLAQGAKEGKIIQLFKDKEVQGKPLKPIQGESTIVSRQEVAGEIEGITFAEFETSILERMSFYKGFWQTLKGGTIKNILEIFYRHPEAALAELQTVASRNTGGMKLELTALRQILEEFLMN